ncbi:MAG: anthranilate synthase component I family protein, partial [Cardiobacterium sp.]
MPYLLLDDARAGRARLYRDHIRRDTLTAADLDQLDALLARGWANSLHAALRIPYEFGLALMELAESAPPLVLDWYARLDHLHGDAIDAWLRAQHDGAPAGLLGLQFDTDRAAYARNIATIHELIRAGNTYQVNYTLRANAESYGNPVALYQRLRALQPAPYAALAWHPQDGHTLCLSPELFLARDGEQLHTLPMKGTARAEGDIEAAKAALARDPKNRAENTMIVDLLRNDLSKIAQLHGVTVSDAFHVEQHGEVLQMTSRVNARLRSGTSYAAILRAAYPCGSITGAPKRITMQYIAALESSPRDLYTGALGYIEPDSMRLNVAIRTLQITG